MDHPTLIAVFLVIATIAIVVQMLVLLGFLLMAWRIYKEARLFRHKSKLEIDLVVAGFRDFLEIISCSKDSIKTITADAAEVSHMVRGRAASVDAALGEIVEKTRLQLERIDILITTLVDRVETAATTVQRTILRPVQEIGALTRGIQTGLDFLLSHRHTSRVREATQDEEMFI
jgi:hypothetical protein